MRNRCPICGSKYNPQYNVPKKMPCGHTHCLICMIKELATDGRFDCKFCNETIDNEKQLRLVPVDFEAYDNSVSTGLASPFKESAPSYSR